MLSNRYWRCPHCKQIYRPLWSDTKWLPLAPRDMKCSDCNDPLKPCTEKQIEREFKEHGYGL